MISINRLTQPGLATHIILRPAQLRLLNHPSHQILVPEEPIICALPHRLPLLIPLRRLLVLALQTVRQVPAVREPQFSGLEALLDEVDELLLDGVLEDRGGRGERGEGEKAEVGREVDGVGEQAAGRNARGDDEEEVGCGGRQALARHLELIATELTGRQAYDPNDAITSDHPFLAHRRDIPSFHFPVSPMIPPSPSYSLTIQRHPPRPPVDGERLPLGLFAEHRARIGRRGLKDVSIVRDVSEHVRASAKAFIKARGRDRHVERLVQEGLGHGGRRALSVCLGAVLQALSRQLSDCAMALVR